MIRYFLARGDRAGGAVINDGLTSVTCSNPPPSVEIATLGMKTWCDACGREGYIAPRGPRLRGNGPNGKPWALSGDINVCGCNPPPVFDAVRGMKMVLTAEDIAAFNGSSNLLSGATPADIPDALADESATYDEQVCVLIDTTLPQRYPYLIETNDGRIFSGRTNCNGQLPRVDTAADEDYTIYWGDDALAHKSWK